MSLHFYDTVRLIFPHQILLSGLIFYISSFWIGRKLSSIAFLILFLFGSYGVSLFSIAFLFSGIYASGYILNATLMKNRTFEPTNITYGIFLLFFPITFLSILSSTKIVRYSPFFSQTAWAVAICTFLLTSSLIFFIVKERCAIRDNVASFLLKNNIKEESKLSNISIFILLIFLFSILNYSSIPLINYDDMGTHYPLQHRFANGLYPDFDVRMHVWAVSQWVFDLYYGLFEYLFPEQGRKFLNSILSISIVAIIYKCMRQFLNEGSALLYAVVCCSTPLFVLSLTTSQTELITTLLLVSVIYLFVNYNHQSLVMLLPVFSFSVALKPSNAVLFLFPLIAVMIIEYKKYKFSVLKTTRFWMVLFLCIFCAFITYVFAYIKTGNPFFPLFNGYFKAAHFPEINFFNSLYSGHFNFGAFWGLLFNTPMYLESYNYVAGFQLLLLPLIICMIPLCFKNNYELSILTLSITIGGIVLFHSQQYARYLMPCITLLPVLYFLTIKSYENFNSKLKTFLVVFLLIVGLTNSYFIPNVIWYLKSWNNNFLLVNNVDKLTVNDLDPILSVNRFLNSIPEDKVVVYPLAKPYAANLNDKYIYLNWYNTAASNAVSGGKKSQLNYFKMEGVTHLVIDQSSSDADKNIAKETGTLIYDAYGYQVYKLF